MDVESYRHELGLTYEQLADKLRLPIDVGHMRRIARGLIWPRASLIDSIVEHSGGAVTVDDMHRRYSAQRARIDTDPTTENVFQRRQTA